MSDRYQQLVNTPIGKIVSKQIGLPNPVKLERYERGQPVINGPVLLGAAPGGRLAGAIAKVLAAIDADVHTPMQDEVRTAAADAHLDAKVFNPDAAPEDQTFKALVFDASGIADSDAAARAVGVLSPDDPAGAQVGARDRARDAARGLQAPPPGDRPAGARGVRALGRQGGAQGRHRPAGLRRDEGRAADRVDAPVRALAEVGVRVRSGRSASARPPSPPTRSTGSFR